MLAAFVHGALVTLHALGAVYNMRKDNRWQAGAHIAGIAFSAHSVGVHLRAVRETEGPL